MDCRRTVLPTHRVGGEKKLGSQLLCNNTGKKEREMLRECGGEKSVVVFGLQDSRQKMKFSKLRPGGLQRKRKRPRKGPARKKRP